MRRKAINLGHVTYICCFYLFFGKRALVEGQDEFSGKELPLLLLALDRLFPPFRFDFDLPSFDCPCFSDVYIFDPASSFLFSDCSLSISFSILSILCAEMISFRRAISFKYSFSFDNPSIFASSSLQRKH